MIKLELFSKKTFEESFWFPSAPLSARPAKAGRPKT